jgi:hypothetical protein
MIALREVIKESDQHKQDEVESMARKIEENILSALDRLEDVTQKARGEMRERERRYHHRQTQDSVSDLSSEEAENGEGEEQRYFVSQASYSSSGKRPTSDYGEAQPAGPKGELNHVLGELMALRRQREDLEERIQL